MIDRAHGLVRVTAVGFGQTDSRELGAGAVVTNASSSDALGVEVTFNAINSRGRIVGSDTADMQLVPAHSTVYMGTDVFTHGRASRIEAFAQVDGSVSHRYSLPRVSNVRVQRDPYLGIRVTGEVHNTLHGTLSSFARIGIVIFDRSGRIVGGGYTFPDGDLPSGRRIAFEAGNGVDATSSSRASCARASMDNQGRGFDPVR